MTKSVQPLLRSEKLKGVGNNIHRSSKYKDAMVILFSAFLVSSLLSTPEGSVREGDFLPVAFLFLILASMAFAARLIISFLSPNSSLLESEDTHNPSTNTHKSWRKFFSLPVIADSSIILFLFLSSASCLKVVLQHTGDVRFAINGLWTSVTPILVYLFLRFFKFLTMGKYSHVLSLVIATCVMSESLFSLYSYTILDPQKRAAYLANPDKLLIENGISLPPDSRERELFENRLLSSVEPIGTYGLTNTLAAFLLPPLVIIILGVPWKKLLPSKIHLDKTFPKESCNTHSPLSQIILSFITLSSVGLLLYIFLLTKSRTAFISLIFSLLIGVIVKISRRQTNTSFSLRYLWLLLIPVSLAFVTNGLDLPVITEAFKSLSYRFEYWEATLGIVNRSPLLGIGPGEFQNIYPRYILPTASEFIADPHNFILEIGALYGIPALGCLLVFFLSICMSAFSLSVPTSRENQEGEDLNKANISGTSSVANTVLSSKRSFSIRSTFILGACLGIVFTFLCSGFQSAPVALEMYPCAILAILSFFFVTYLLFPYTNKVVKDTLPVIPSWILGMSLVVCLFNLLGTGGINYPPISILLFVTSAVLTNRRSLNEIDACSPKEIASSKKTLYSIQNVFLLTLSMGLVFMFKTTALAPRNRSFQFEQLCFQDPATFVSMLNRYSPEEIDKHSSFIALQYYYKASSEYFKNPSERNQLNWREAGNYLRFTSPNSPSLRESCANYDKQLFNTNSKRVEFLDSAITFYYESVERSPTDANKHANLAQLLLCAKRENEAMEQIDKALFYDNITFHEDRKISPETRIEFQKLRSRLQENI